MAVTIRLFTQMGPFQNGSILIVTPAYARVLINQYGQGLRIESTYPGTFWFQDGAVLSVYSRRGPPPRPRPPQPQPPVTGSVNVIFRNQVTDPSSGFTYNPGVTYQFTLPRLQALNANVNNLSFTTFNGRPVNPDDFSNFIGRTLYAESVIFAFNQ